MAARSARSAETSAADRATGVAGQASRRYAYAPCAGRAHSRCGARAGESV